MMIKKWASGISTVVLFAMLLSVLFFAVSSKISGGSPRVFGYELLTVLSGSMEPTIHTGSVIAVKPVHDATQFSPGDVITFRPVGENNMFITHRIIEIKGIGKDVQYVTKGDNNDAADAQPVPASNVAATYVNFTIPFLGHILAFTKSKAGLIIFLILPGLALVVWQIISLWKMISRLDEEEQEPQEPVLKIE